MSYDLDQDEELPSPVRATRIALFIGAGLTGLMVVGALLAAGFSAETLGRLTWFAWPGVAALVIALKMRHGGRRLFWATVIVCAFWILSALGSLGQGDPRGITQLIIPVTCLVLVTRPSAKAFFLDLP